MATGDSTMDEMHGDELILTNARVVGPSGVCHGHVVVREGTIAEVGEGGARVPGAIDLDGDLLTPGLVELHSDNLEHHVQPRPKVQWPFLPAIMAHDAQIAGAGITTILDALRLGDDDVGSEAGPSAQLVEAIAEAGRRNMLRAEHLLHIRAELPVPGLAEAVEPFTWNPSLRLVSLMDHSPGQRQFQDIEVWKGYYRGKFGYTEDQLAKLAGELKERAATHGASNRSALAKLCVDHYIPLASHDDTTVEHVAEAAELGVSVSEFPTTLAAAEAAHRAGIATVAGAPNVVRGGSHSGNVAAEELVGADVLDCLSSDYVPVSLLHAGVRPAPQDRPGTWPTCSRSSPATLRGWSA
ncbi:MAG: alpha-D-ribose 1-methylphosphonate 5-triphosphate diphosphatase [Rhodovibrio sp.]|nr:alpha-D-ribose 1-methylphosphonate 5-triphosphate diphosphatase [Rhodovibrio sp.]